MNRILSLAASGALLASAGLATSPADAGGVRAIRANAGGGYTYGAAVGRRGPNGGIGARAGTTTVNADGSASHRSGLQASGSRGSIQSSGSATRDASGNVTQSRSTSATNAVTGNSVQSSSSYNSATGLTRSATCYNASGAVIACR